MNKTSHASVGPYVNCRPEPSRTDQDDNANEVQVITLQKTLLLTLHCGSLYRGSRFVVIQHFPIFSQGVRGPPSRQSGHNCRNTPVLYMITKFPQPTERDNIPLLRYFNTGDRK